MTKFRKFAFAALAVVSPVAALAQESAGDAYQVPAAVTAAVGSMQNAATGLAGSALPAVVNIGLPFVGIAVIYLLFRVLKRFASGR